MSDTNGSAQDVAGGRAADAQHAPVQDTPAAAVPPPCRLYALLARDVPHAIILRRGPSKWVQLILWYTDDDTFTWGQWFHGRIYERRCDLSPDGRFFLYFASKINTHTTCDPEYTYAWTALSKPPYLTALALWPKGDCWDGGGLFRGRRTVMLNHDPAHRTPHPAHSPKGLTVRFPGSVEEQWPRGEDNPLHAERLERDGWHLDSSGVWPRPSVFGDRWMAEQPTVWQKPDPSGAYRLTWTLRAYEWGRLGGAEVADYVVTSVTTKERCVLTEATWADWDQRGRLVFTREGRLYTTRSTDPLGEATLRADFNDQHPYTLAAPAWAQTW